jgi:hypothetical protein
MAYRLWERWFLFALARANLFEETALDGLLYWSARTAI